jgi:methyl coenzyme M reductase beta subunit
MVRPNILAIMAYRKEAANSVDIKPLFEPLCVGRDSDFALVAGDLAHTISPGSAAGWTCRSHPAERRQCGAPVPEAAAKVALDAGGGLIAFFGSLASSLLQAAFSAPDKARRGITPTCSARPPKGRLVGAATE